jgi:hypothetical protein
MVANDTQIIFLIADNLYVSVAVLASSKVFISLPLEGLELDVIVGQVFLTEFFLSVFFA